jgi:hypothetical protein
VGSKEGRPRDSSWCAVRVVCSSGCFGRRPRGNGTGPFAVGLAAEFARTIADCSEIKSFLLQNPVERDWTVCRSSWFCCRFRESGSGLFANQLDFAAETGGTRVDHLQIMLVLAAQSTGTGMDCLQIKLV